jgi:hypothetical protein
VPAARTAAAREVARESWPADLVFVYSSHAPKSCTLHQQQSTTWDWGGSRPVPRVLDLPPAPSGLVDAVSEGNRAAARPSAVGRAGEAARTRSATPGRPTLACAPRQHLL